MNAAVRRAVDRDPKMVVAASIRATRRQRGWSQEVLAKFAGVHSTEISRLERGLREPRLLTVVKVAAALGVPVGRLLGEELTSTAQMAALAHTVGGDEVVIEHTFD